ncbi:MAG: GerW family sporulation protein [Clostridia bacterium]|nr:GerW family sporulation protein [Clostridia bacterium]
MENKVNNLLGVSMEKIKEMVDVNMVVGDPIALADGVTILPVSRISYGFASGGSDLPSKIDRDVFGGGAGAGINVTPLAFLVVKNGEVNMLPVVTKSGALDHAISMVPGLIDKVSGFFKKDKTEITEEETQVSELTIE